MSYRYCLEHPGRMEDGLCARCEQLRRFPQDCEPLPRDVDEPHPLSIVTSECDVCGREVEGYGQGGWCFRCVEEDRKLMGWRGEWE